MEQLLEQQLAEVVVLEQLVEIQHKVIRQMLVVLVELVLQIQLQEVQ